MGIPN